ncbi:MAG: hypothetical protein KAX05_11330 [Bacteroidales bacterium]|nr:hypothetical protein [Bacteroidales bacterium]
MKTLTQLSGFAILVLITMTSCTKEEFDSVQNIEIYFDGVQNIEIYAIKSVVRGDKTILRYIYNRIGKIAENEGRYFYNRYSYDNNGRLIKQESAVDLSVLFSFPKTELMTFQNCTITSYKIFKYDQEEKLIEIKNYYKKEGDFVYTSMNSLEYNGDLIVKRNLHNKDGTITQFYTYEYDNNGNVEREKYYSYLFTESSEPRLISENTFKYDNKKNPFIIFKELGIPGLYTNTNNRIETNSILYEYVPGIDKFSTSKIAYEYNQYDYPVKEISDNDEYEYKY